MPAAEPLKFKARVFTRPKMWSDWSHKNGLMWIEDGKFRLDVRDREMQSMRLIHTGSAVVVIRDIGSLEFSMILEAEDVRVKFRPLWRWRSVHREIKRHEIPLISVSPGYGDLIWSGDEAWPS